MNDLSQSTRAEARAGEAGLCAADPEPVENPADAAVPAAFRLAAREVADRPRREPHRSVGRERGTETGGNVFVTVVSHELRNSLGAIRSAICILGAEASPGLAVQARVLIERQVCKMTALVADLVDISRSQHAPTQVQREPNDLRVIATNAVRTVEFTMRQRNHRMATSFPHAPVWVQADAARLEQVFVNLLFNAAKYTDPGGDIELSVGREDGAAVVRVRDNGIGIDPDVLPQVFDLFFQADPSSRHADAGLGIGLALVRSVVDRHGGRVTATSAGLGCGSEFVVHLPTAEPVSVSERTDAEP